MSTSDIDLDVYNLLVNVPEDQVVFYFRAGDEAADDFLYAKGNLEEMGGTLANLMKQNKDLEIMVAHAVKAFQE